MNPLEFEPQRKELIAELSTLFASVDFNTLLETAKAVEAYTISKLRRLVCANAESIFKATETNSDVGIFNCGATEYQIKVGDYVPAPDEMVLAILRHDLEEKANKSDLKPHVVKIRGFGRYQRVTIFIPSKMELDREFLDHVIKASLETIYAWFEEQIIKIVRAETNAMANELYGHARTIFLDREIGKKFWFGAMSGGRGFRLFDEFVATSALQIAQQHSSKFGRGANDVVAEILKTNLPIERLLMRHSIGREDPIDVDIADAAYYKDHSSYSDAMRSFYGSTSFTIFPILTDAGYNDKVIALYPTSLKSDIEPILRSHRTTLREISLNSHKKIRATLSALKRRPTDMDWFAAFAGKFTRGFVEG